ncbi:ATP-binding protein [Leptospira licerasiae]|uniref:ATP-binding protein n=1 Tax=Leptospira licerasiae TaxID=447106 RepID=UPI00301B013C
MESNRIQTQIIGKEQEEFFQGYSKPRNKVLMRGFKDLGIVEFLGSGLPRILQTYPRDHFHFGANFQRITLPMSEKSSEKIAKFLSKNPEATKSDLAIETGLTTRAVEKNLKNLQSEGKIKRIGPDKGGHWEVSP